MRRSMYGPEQWGLCFPVLSPYGDGVFGLPRRNCLTFQQCASMHLLRGNCLSKCRHPISRNRNNGHLKMKLISQLPTQLLALCRHHVNAPSAPMPPSITHLRISLGGGRAVSSCVVILIHGDAWSKYAKPRVTCCGLVSRSVWRRCAKHPPKRSTQLSRVLARTHPSRMCVDQQMWTQMSKPHYPSLWFSQPRCVDQTVRELGCDMSRMDMLWCMEGQVA